MSLVFYHAPHSRSGGTRILFEELGVQPEMHVLDLQRGDQTKPEYLAINPMGKVPAIVHDGVLVIEQPAIMVYLADAFPEKRLAPAIGDPLRGPYLRWMVFYGSCYEPALIDKFRKLEPAPRATSPYADYDTVIAQVRAQVEQGPWWLGERFTAADVLWGTALAWTTQFGLVEKTPAIARYIERVLARPAVARARAADEALAAEQAQARA